jgi:hypothetical protein
MLRGQSLLSPAPTEKLSRLEHGRDFRPVLPILVYNFADIQPKVLAQAQAVATKIFSEAKLEPVWIICPGHQACGGETKRPEFRIRIISGAKDIAVHPIHDQFGFAVACDRSESACVSYAFYVPIRDLAQRFEKTPGFLLGLVMAHEVGHALLGPNAHAESGIMQATLPVTAVEHMFYFMSGQAKRMQADLMARSGEGGAP